MAKLLALDLSTKSTGWAVQLEDGTIESGVIKCSYPSSKRRIAHMGEEVIKLVKKYKVKQIVAEDIRTNDISTVASRTLMWLQGAIVLVLYLYDETVGIDFLAASSWRSKLGIQGYRVKRDEQKLKDIAYANEKYGKQLTEKEDDEADALCLLAAYQVKDDEPKLGFC